MKKGQMGALFPGSRDLIKAMNRSLLLNMIRREGQISRTQLTELSGLSAGAVSGIINELLADEWVFKTGEGAYTGGRRQSLLRLNPEAGYAVGLKLMEDRIVSAVIDFEAQIRLQDESPFPFDDDPEKLSDILAKVVETSIVRSGVSTACFFGAGIGLAGVIDAQAGVVRYSPFFGWRNVALAERVSHRLRVPVFVENDVNTLTITEQLFGAGRRHHNFIVVTVGRGIGMGMVINGQLYQGHHGGAGEVGHSVIDASAADRGADTTLEGLAADPALMQRVNHDSGSNSPIVANVGELAARAAQGDAEAQAALAQSGAWLGIGIANIVNVLAPELIIISGEGVSSGPYRLDAMLGALRHNAFDGLLDNIEITVRETDDQAWARGAASLVLSKVFASPVLNVHIR
jgi:N-acetylglucosamine repressor